MNKKGFTLIELLVVIAILGLLSTLAVVALGSAREKARDSKRLSDLKQVQTALELYYTDQGAYPTAATAVTLGSAAAACFDGSTAGWMAKEGCTSPYMGQVPSDPGSNSYSYVSAAGTTYTISATLEGKVGDLSGAIQLTPAGIADVAS
ncbi:MAG: prepilin-type N-terminal cleavage/methylation domain-containing protein [Patescibacteria group bacterium]